MYQVPWEVTLPYGPVMWAPLVVPLLLHADVRFVTLVGVLFVPAACGIAAVVDAARGRLRAGRWLADPGDRDRGQPRRAALRVRSATRRSTGRCSR